MRSLRIAFFIFCVGFLCFACSAKNSFSMAERYQDNGDGTVTDVETGLQWMRCSLGQLWNGQTCEGEAQEYHWDTQQNPEFLVLAAYYGGFRFPTKEELATLVHCSSGLRDKLGGCDKRYARPTIDRVAFPNTPEYYFWTSTPSSYHADFDTVSDRYFDSKVRSAYGVYFYSGNVSSLMLALEGKGSGFHVRLVRSVENVSKEDLITILPQP
jgi:hypothetical protein